MFGVDNSQWLPCLGHMTQELFKDRTGIFLAFLLEICKYPHEKKKNEFMEMAFF